MKINELVRVDGKMESVTRDMTAEEIEKYNKKNRFIYNSPTEKERLEALEEALIEMAGVLYG